MPTESELRALLHDGGTPGALNTGDIIRRARARRRPKRAAVGALGGLAALALVVPVAISAGSFSPLSASDGAAAPAHNESAEDMSTRSEGGSLAEDPYPGCRLPGWDGEAVPLGVELRVSQPTPGGVLELTLMNGSARELHGRVAGAPLIVVSNGDEPLGWSTAALTAASEDADRIALAPGEQRTFEVPLDVVGCAGTPVTGTVGVEAGLAIELDDGTTTVATSERRSVVVAPAE